MKILIGTDYYYPSVGGQQIVLKEISERLVKRGHSVTVVTSIHTDRINTDHNGVNIKDFNISGSFVHGLAGDIQEYHNFIINGNFDVIMIKAAQGWTVDALIPILDDIKIRKIFIPCGFSALYDEYYSDYYKLMPSILKKFDHLIFYASDYRDINFARKNNINNFSIIPNGASEVEFLTMKEDSFRKRLDIPDESIILLTVGTFTGGKGHYELAQAFQKIKTNQNLSLILNGNYPSGVPKLKTSRKFSQYLKMGLIPALKKIYADILITLRIRKIGKNKDWSDIAKKVNSQNDGKKVYITNLSREDVIQAYLNSDLFVFASNVEYSPLVLFESAAAGLPFLTVPVGNSEEIIEWTQGGVLCPSEKDRNGRTTVDVDVLAKEMEKLINDPEKRKILGTKGKMNWSEKFTWEKITIQYEKILKGN